eukprot:359622-Chlamydomonas_euryale.AAC.7
MAVDASLTCPTIEWRLGDWVAWYVSMWQDSGSAPVSHVPVGEMRLIWRGSGPCAMAYPL